ncbi:MAG: DNA alkylation repair protein [Nanoarchaeota archaeon]
MNELLDIKSELKRYSSPERSQGSIRFFKTGPGEYGEGDKFIGVSVPDTRKVAKKYYSADLADVGTLMSSVIHEERLLGLFILVNKYKKNPKMRDRIFNFYLDNISRVNNWDLVDSSADKIVGEFLLAQGDLSFLKKLALSDNLWERRIAIVSTFAHIRAKSYGASLYISDLLLKDNEDLIHKACGWMLREVGKRNLEILKTYLIERYKIMPRTMLRYSIERFPEAERKRYLRGEI